MVDNEAQAMDFAIVAAQGPMVESAMAVGLGQKSVAGNSMESCL